jgi:hypothetical protein
MKQVHHALFTSKPGVEFYNLSRAYVEAGDPVYLAVWPDGHVTCPASVNEAASDDETVNIDTLYSVVQAAWRSSIARRWTETKEYSRRVAAYSLDDPRGTT